MNRRLFLQATGLAAIMNAIARRKAPAAESMSGVCAITHEWPGGSGSVLLAGSSGTAEILVDQKDHAVVHIAARMLAQDMARITGHVLPVTNQVRVSNSAIIVGTLGHSHWIDALAAAGKIQVHGLKGKWESFIWQTVDHPLPGVGRALVIAGSDRRGTSYGVMELCEISGVSPWFWWADVPVKKAACVAVTPGRLISGPPGVKYRGIFINDEDWEFQPWAAHTFDPARGNVGPKTYKKVFELMLRLKLNYLWPAMHPCSASFASIPQNAALASDYAIVMGSSHVEPMLANPAAFLGHPGHMRRGPWNFVTNSANILKFWAQSVKSRGQYEAVWTLGMRGPYDSALLGVHTRAQERTLVERIFHLQANLLRRLASRRWGLPATCYVPYKEALLVFNSGLKVPPDATIVWPDNNFGYIRQLSNAPQRRRSGGSGVYYHIEYLGKPHSYCWLNTTPPALMWEELKKAWDNEARQIWVINVGGIKPREISMDFAARLAWRPQVFGADCQPVFLRHFAETVCGPEYAATIADLLQEFFLLGQIRRPESMNRNWAAELPDQEATDLLARYQRLFDNQRNLQRRIPPESRAAFFELFAYPAQMLAASGLIFLLDRHARATPAQAEETGRKIALWRRFIVRQVAWYNNKLRNAKWRDFATMGGTTWRVAWASVQWPWLDHHKGGATRPGHDSLLILPAYKFERTHSTATAQWRRISGLGRSGGAMALWPAVPQNRWNPEKQLSDAPRIDYQIHITRPIITAMLVLSVLPTYPLYPGMNLRIAIRWNGGPAKVLTVPYASSEIRVAGNRVRAAGVLANQIPLHYPVGPLSNGLHTLSVYAVDPGVVLDEILLQGDNTPHSGGRSE